MPLIHEETNSSDIETEQKIMIRKTKLQTGQNEKFSPAVFHGSAILEEDVKNKAGVKENNNTKISELAESMARMTEYTMHKIEQEKNARISKLAESMAKMTEATLCKIEQNESEKISKIIANMHMLVETSNDQFGPRFINSKNDAKSTKLKENSDLPWFQ